MKALITTIKGEEYCGEVAGFINLAYNKLNVGLSSNNFGIFLSMRIAPLTFDIIDYIEIHYTPEILIKNFNEKEFYFTTRKTFAILNLEDNSKIYKKSKLYTLSAIECRNIFFDLKDKFLKQQIIK